MPSSSSSGGVEGATDPVSEEFEETTFYCGRYYQQYAINQEAYFCPIDEDEREALNKMHEVIKKALGHHFDNALIVPPISRIRKILDCGFGTGAWAYDVVERYPNCKVIGVDISGHLLPPEEPEDDDDSASNFVPQIDDLNSKFNFPENHFDLVHSQLVAGGIHSNRWKEYLKDIFHVIRPGGWCQMVELYLNPQSDNGTLSSYSSLRRWWDLYQGGISPMKDPRAALQMKRWAERAGFTDVQTTMIKLPTCEWARRDAALREIGRINRQNVHSFLSSVATYVLTQFQGLSENDVHLLVAQARNEADNPAYKPYFTLYVTIGKKPR